MRRRDALFFAASDACDLLLQRRGLGRLPEILTPWTTLPGVEDSPGESAYLHQSLAQVLYLAGRNQEALDAYRKARTLFENTGDQLGQGNSWKAKPTSSSYSDETRKPLDAYRKRALSSKIPALSSDKETPWRGEADILFLLGRNQEALDAYRSAHSLRKYRHSARTRKLLERRSRHPLPTRTKPGSSRCLPKSPHFFENTGTQLGQGNSWIGEADILFLLGRNQEALDAYRKARTLFENTGTQLGQGNSWKGEADILFRLGRNQEALDAY